MRGREKRERQDHSACRATREEKEELKDWFVQKEEAGVDSLTMLLFGKKKKPLRKCLSCEFCRDFIESSDVGCREREQASKRHYWNWSIDTKTFNLVAVTVAPGGHFGHSVLHGCMTRGCNVLHQDLIEDFKVPSCGF